MTIDVDGLLSSLLRIVGESEDYFVSGSLSFLPLTGRYREPEHDVDGISRSFACTRWRLRTPRVWRGS
jgi:hypothetical protein